MYSNGRWDPESTCFRVSSTSQMCSVLSITPLFVLDKAGVDQTGDTSSSVSCGQLWMLMENDRNRARLYSFPKFLLTRSRLIYACSALKGNGSPQLHECYHTITHTDTIKIWDGGNTSGHYILNSGMCPPEGD